MDKSALIQILAALDPQDLIKALSVQGMSPQGGEDAVLAGLSASDEKVPGWGERKISLKGSDNRPSLLDKEWIEQPMSQDPGTPINWVMGDEEQGAAGLPPGVFGG
jgi:hypothetical protein